MAWDPRIEDHFEHGVLWAELGPEGNVEAELDKWGALIGLDMAAYQDVAARSQALQGWLHEQKALLIVDDVWDVEKARAFLVGGAGCRAVVTTRQKAIADDLAAEDPTHVKPLKPKDGLDLLRQLAPKAVAEDEQAARGLAKALDGLPLGIELAGRVLRRRTRVGLNAAGVIEELADREKRLDATDEAKRSAKDEAKRSLRAVIALSYDNLPRDETRACFRALSLFGAKPLSFSLGAAQAVWDADETAAEEAIMALVESGLVDLENGKGQEDAAVRYALHATIADFAESELARSSDTDPIADRRHTFYVDLARETPQDEWKSLLPEIQQLDRAFQWAAERHDGARADGLELATNDFLNRQALWNTNLTWLHRCLELATARGDRKREASLLHREGYVHDNRGEWEQALERYEQSREIKEEIGDRGGLARTLNNIGMIHSNRGEWEQALERFEQSREIQEEIGDQGGLAATLNNIGFIHDNRGEREQALELYEQSREIQEEIGDRGGLAVTLNNIGMIHANRGEWEQALELYEQSRGIQEEIRDRGGLAVTLNNIGMIHDKRGEWEQALEQYEQSRGIREEIGDRGGLAVTLFNIARLYEERGRYGEALPLLERVVELDEQIGHPDLESDREVLERVRRKVEEP